MRTACPSQWSRHEAEEQDGATSAWLRHRILKRVAVLLPGGDIPMFPSLLLHQSTYNQSFQTRTADAKLDTTKRRHQKISATVLS
jgi:hypothetical protein